MLPSTLPRAFLAPGLSYFAGYYGDQIHPYTSYMTLGAEEPYTKIGDPQTLSSWDINSRSSTPCPLDLSLKPSSTPRSEECESIEVDYEDLKSREEVERHLNAQRRRYLLFDNEEELVVDDVESQYPCSSVRSPGYDLLREKDPLMECHRSDISRSAYLMETQHKYQQLQHHNKLHLTSPHLQSIPSYHQQQLLTPQHQIQGIHSPMTPPSTPSPPQCPSRRLRDEDAVSPSSTTPKQVNQPAEKHVLPRPKKKHARRLKFDEDTSSPVSGTVILGPDEAVVTGDIDPAFNIVEVTDEARAELAKIENRLGPYQCKLCRQLHEDAFQLAQHRCSRIAHVEYRCPECDKRFSCPANLASHRRWHKPRAPNGEVGASSTSLSTSSVEVTCTRCDAKFTRQAALRKHIAVQHPESINNNNNTSNNNNNDSNGFPEIVKPIVCSPGRLGTNPLAVEMA